MSRQVQCPSKQDQHAVIQFLTAEGCRPAEIHRRMAAVYDKCYSKTAVKMWCCKFQKGRQQTADLRRPGQAHRAVTDENVSTIDLLLRDDRRRSVASIATQVNVSVGTVHNIIKSLGYNKVCCQWVPRLLTEDQRTLRMGLSLTHLQRYQRQGNDFLRSIVAGNETWCLYYEPS